MTRVRHQAQPGLLRGMALANHVRADARSAADGQWRLLSQPAGEFLLIECVRARTTYVRRRLGLITRICPGGAAAAGKSLQRSAYPLVVHSSVTCPRAETNLRSQSAVSTLLSCDETRRDLDV